MILLDAALCIPISILAARLESIEDARTSAPEHKLSATIRSVVAVSLSTLVILSNAKEVGLDVIIMIVMFSAHLLCYYWIVFDFSYNHEANKHLLYRGTESILDNKSKKYLNQASYIFVKIAALLVTGLVNYHFFTNYSLG